MKIDSLNFSYPVQNTYKKVTMLEENLYNENQIKDSIEISDIGKSLSKINSREIDSQKLNSIRDKIGSGSYSVDSKDLARKIIDSFQSKKS